MSLSSWICTCNSKQMLLRIVHPGGRIELHDSPVLAAEIMCRNPGSCVAYPHVFQQPWAIVEPETMLMLGQKFYVVPLSTIRKLQGLSPRHSPSPAHSIKGSPSPVHGMRNLQSSIEEKDDGMISTCFFRKNTIPKQPCNCKNHSRDNKEISEIRMDTRKVNLSIRDKDGCFSDNCCFMRLSTGVKTKANINDVTKERGASPSSTALCDVNTQTRQRTRNLTGNGTSPGALWSSEHWQPSLDSVIEE